MSNRIFQSVIVQMKEATDRKIGVINSEGAIIASSDLELIGTVIKECPLVSDEKNEKVIKGAGRTFKLMGKVHIGFDYAVFVEGEDDIAETICVMAFIAISETKIYYEENHDKGVFIKSIISDNILPGDIYAQAKEFNFVSEVTRAVLLVRQLDDPDIEMVNLLKSMFPDTQRDFVISVNETDIAIIKELPSTFDQKYVDKLAESIEKRFVDDFNIKVVIGIGTYAKHLRELADRYKEAQVAIAVGKVFETEKTIINYESLGIGRLIYQLPTTLCEMFLSEVFKKNPIESLDQETLYTINKFFENNLNVSETSRKLFVHRNTLVYRLEKIKKLTALDLREFDHAIVFKVALMVKKYLDSHSKG